jgi:TonB family protein
MSANGDGVPQDHAEAVRWYRKAAAKKNADAQRSLGMCFATGQGVGKDLIQAAVWLNLAAAQNDTLAQRLRQRLEMELTPAQAAQADSLARQWNGEDSVAGGSGAVACEGLDLLTPVAVGGSVTSPRLIRRVEPAYPPQLRAARLRGRVTLKAVIDASGDVRNVEVLASQNASFSKAAIDAVRQWKYDPAMRAGCTVPVALTVGLEFNGG